MKITKEHIGMKVRLKNGKVGQYEEVLAVDDNDFWGKDEYGSCGTYHGYRS